MAKKENELPLAVKETMPIETSRLYPNGGIGASQIAALWPTPAHPYLTRADVYMSALGLAKPKTPSLSMRRGNLAEQYLRAAFELSSHKKINPDFNQCAFTHHEYPFILCHVDAMTTDSVGVELKHVEENENMWGDEPEQLPQFHYLQIQHSMVASGRKSWWYYCEVPKGGQGKAWLEFRCHEFQAELKIHEAIIELCKTAWKEIGDLHALMKKGPQERAEVITRLKAQGLTESEKIQHAAKVLYPFTPREPSPAPTEMLADLREYATQRQYKKAAEDNLGGLAATILINMGARELQTVTWDGGKITRRKDGALVFSPEKRE